MDKYDKMTKMTQLPHEGFEKLDALASKEDIDLVLSELKKSGVESKVVTPPSGPYEIWVRTDGMFTALGIYAKFRIEQKKRAEFKKEEQSDRRKTAGKSAKAVFVSICLILFAYVGYQTRRLIISLESGASRIRITPPSVRGGTYSFEKDFERLMKQSREFNKDLSKKEWRLGTLMFRWSLSRAEKAYAAGKFEKAMSGFEKCLKHEPENRPVVSILFQIYIRLNRQDKVRPLLQNFLSMPLLEVPWKKWAHLELADLFIREKDYSAAESELGNILEMEPGDREALKKRAFVNAEMGYFYQASGYLEKALSIQEDPQSRIFLGRLYLKSKLPDKALRAVITVYENAGEPQHAAEAALLLAEISLNSGRREKAGEYLNKAGSLMHHSENYFLLNAVYLYLNRQFTPSSESFLHVLALAPSSVIAKLYLNLIALKEGKTEQFKETLSGLKDYCTGADEKALYHYSLACLEIINDSPEKAWSEFLVAYNHDKFLWKRFADDPLIARIKQYPSYGRFMQQLKSDN